MKKRKFTVRRHRTQSSNWLVKVSPSHSRTFWSAADAEVFAGILNAAHAKKGTKE